MKIAVIVSSFPDLSETFILNQIVGLLDRGHTVRVFASNRPEQHGKVDDDIARLDLLRHTRYIPGRTGSLLTARAPWLQLLRAVRPTHLKALCRALRIRNAGATIESHRFPFAIYPFLDDDGDYDIVHCHFGRNGVLAALLRQTGALSGKVLTTFHGSDVHTFPRLHGRDVYETAFRSSDRFTANSNFTRDCVIALGCPPERITKLPVGLYPDRYRFQEKRLAGNETVRLLSVARLVDKKGLRYAIEAIPKVLDRHPNLTYDILGDGPLHQELAGLITRLDLSNHVRLRGWKTSEEVTAYFARSHIFVLPSVTADDGDMEGQGLVLQEAQASGLPVVSTLHNGIPEGVLDDVSGHLVPERDSGALAEALNRLLDHPDTWSAMGHAGRQLVEEQFDIDKLNDRLVELYRGLLDDTEGIEAAPTPR
jgi:colanic acid/amylovoran biosynthesis glycosyltransferase